MRKVGRPAVEAVGEGETAVGYGHLVRRNTRFRWLWSGQIVSLLGDWFNLIASAALVGALTESGLAVGGLFVVRMLAPFLVSPIAGVAADRYSRKRILILADLGRAVTVLGFLLVRDRGDVWLLYSLTAVQLAISGFFFPARNAILPDIVSERELGAANALSSATWSVMLAFGAALGGIVAGGWGIYPSFVVDSLSFLVSAFCISHVAYAIAPAQADAERTLGAALRQYVAGLGYLKQHPDILAISLQKGAFALTAGGPLQVLQVVLAERIFVVGEGGSTGLGLMYAVAGVGTGIGPIIARRFTGDRNRALRVALAFSYGLSAVGLALMAPLSSFGLVLVGTTLRALGGGIGWVFATQLLLQLVPNYVRGRVFATEFAMFTLMNAIGTAVGGGVLDAEFITLSGELWWMTALTLVPGVLWTIWIALLERPRPAEVQRETRPGTLTGGDK